MNVWQVTGSPHTKAFDMIALCLRESIRELGFTSDIVYTPQPAIVLGAHLLQDVPENCIIYNLEQITSESPLVSETYIELLKNNRVWDYSRRNIRELNKLGIEAVHMPIGYHPVLTRICPQREDIDCLFYGSVNGRRHQIITDTGALPIFNVYDDLLDAYIARSKIILNCHFYETKIFEIVRCSYLLANRKFILSESGLDEELEAPYKEGIAFCSVEELPRACAYYLDNPDKRMDIAQQGFEIFSQMKQVDFLKNEILVNNGIYKRSI